MATSKIRLKKICAWCGNEFEAQKSRQSIAPTDARNMPTKTGKGKRKRNGWK